MALTVEITGGENIDQGSQVTLTATVTDADGNTVTGGLVYSWNASKGSFVGDTDEATAVYRADFSETSNVDVTITCNVTRTANANPTISGPSLTALAEIGVTGILVNMFLTSVGTIATNANSVVYNASTGTIDAGSDQRLSSDIFVHQLRWDNRPSINEFVLNDNETGHIGNFFTGNTDQSVYLIFADGTYTELTPTDFTNAADSGDFWARWQVTDSAILALLNGLSTTDDLVVGVADSGSIGWSADSGSDTETFTTRTTVLSIEAIDEQIITIGTENYDLVVDITGNPDTVEVTGDFEGFSQDWDAANNQLHIIAREAKRLVSMAEWRIKLTKGTETLSRTIIYNVVPAAPVITNPGNLVFYRGISDPDVGDGNYQFIEIANEPSVVRVSGDLTGLVATPGANRHNQEEIGASIEGDIDPNVRFSKSNLTCDIFASNDAGEDTIEDVPVLITGPNPPSNLVLTSEPTGLGVAWDAPTVGTPILDYRIRIRGQAWGTLTETSHKFTNVENNTAYVIDLQARNATGYSPIVSEMVTHAFVEFLWVASGTTLYKLDPATFALAEGLNQIDLGAIDLPRRDEFLRTSDPIVDLAYGGGNLYAAVASDRDPTRWYILRINLTSGEVTQKRSPLPTSTISNTRTVRGFAYEVEVGDDSEWLAIDYNISGLRLHRLNPPGTYLNPYIVIRKTQVDQPRPPADLYTDIRGMDYYEDSQEIWLLNRRTSTIYKVTDNLVDTTIQNSTVSSGDVLQDGSGTTLNRLYGIAIGGGFLWSIRSNGRLYKHDISDLSFDSETDITPTGATAPRAIAYQAGE